MTRFDRRRPAAAQHPERAVADNVGTVDNPTSPVFVPDADRAADRLRDLMTCAAGCGKGSVVWSERRIVGGKAFHEDCLPEPKCQKPVNKCQIATSDDGRERLVDVPPTLDRDEAGVLPAPYSEPPPEEYPDWLDDDSVAFPPGTEDDREVAEEAVQDGMRILSDAGRTQPWLSAGCRKAAEADMLRNPPGGSEGEAAKRPGRGLSVDIRGNPEPVPGEYRGYFRRGRVCPSGSGTKMSFTNPA